MFRTQIGFSVLTARLVQCSPRKASGENGPAINSADKTSSQDTIQHMGLNSWAMGDFKMELLEGLLPGSVSRSNLWAMGMPWAILLQTEMIFLQGFVGISLMLNTLNGM